MFTHIMIGSNDLERSKAFYDATFVALGGQPGEVDARGRLIYSHSGGRLMITTPIDGNPATFANGGTIGIAAASREYVQAWHDAGEAHGGKSIETPPSERPNGAFVACPSSDDLRLFRCLRNGGSGSSGFEVMRPATGAASVFG